MRTACAVDRGIVGIDIGTITAAEDTIIARFGVKATFSDLTVDTAEKENQEKKCDVDEDPFAQDTGLHGFVLRAGLISSEEMPGASGFPQIKSTVPQAQGVSFSNSTRFRGVNWSRLMNWMTS